LRADPAFNVPPGTPINALECLWPVVLMAELATG